MGKKSLPDGNLVELPTRKKLMLLGEIHFVAGRAQSYSKRHYVHMRYGIETAVQLNQAKVFYVEQTPRAFVLWALLSDNYHRYALKEAFDQIPPEGWYSGDNLWMTEICAPYSPQHAKTALRWAYRNFGSRNNPWYYRRIDKPGPANIVKVTPANENRKTRIEYIAG